MTESIIVNRTDCIYCKSKQVFVNEDKGIYWCAHCHSAWGEPEDAVYRSMLRHPANQVKDNVEERA